MIHVYKQNGPWNLDGKSYDCKAIEASALEEYKSKGWVRTLDEVKKPKAKAKVKTDDNKE